MKNFTKQITNKTLFKPTRWLLMALMLLLGTSSAWAAVYVVGNAFESWDTFTPMKETNGKHYYPILHPVKDRQFKLSTQQGWGGEVRGLAGSTSDTRFTFGSNNNNHTIKSNVTNGLLAYDPSGGDGKGWIWTEDYSICVAGASGLTGDNWNTTADPMTYSDGVWSVKFSGVNAGTYQFKVVAGNYLWETTSYDNSKGDLDCSVVDGNISITTPSKGDVTIYFDGKVYVTYKASCATPTFTISGSDQICEGTNGHEYTIANPAVASGVTYAWSNNLAGVSSPSATGSTYTFNTSANGAKTGTITVKATNGTCTHTETKSISQIAKPTAGNLSITSANLKINDTKTITVTGANGGTKSWLSSDEKVATVNSSGVVTAIAAGTATITYTVQPSLSGCGTAATASASITVCANIANITTTPQHIIKCGDTFTQKGQITIDKVDGLTYTCKIGNTTIAVPDNGIITELETAGDYTITATNICDGTASTIVNISETQNKKTLTAISGNPLLCPQTNYAKHTFSVDPINGAKYTWSIESPTDGMREAKLEPSENSVGITTGASGGGAATLKVVATVDGCASEPKTLPLTQLPASNAQAATISGETTMCADATQTLTVSNALGNIDPQWTSSNTAVATVDANGKVTAIATGATNITYSIESACGDRVKSNTLTITVTGTPTNLYIERTSANQVCEGEAITILAKANGATTYQLHREGKLNEPALQTIESTAGQVTFTQTEATAGTYRYVVVIKNACKTTNTEAVQVEVLSTPAAPSFTTNGEITCSGVTVSPTLSDKLADGNYLVWYSAATGGNKIGADGKTLISGADETEITYYAAVSNGSCESADRTPYTVTVESSAISNLILTLVDQKGNPLADNHVYCQGDDVHFKLTYNGGMYWGEPEWNSTVTQEGNMQGNLQYDPLNNKGEGTYTIPSVQASGSIQVALTMCGDTKATSNPLAITVASVPTIDVEPRTTSALCYELVTVTATVTNRMDGALVYWYEGDAQVGTGDEYTFTKKTATTVNNLRAEIRNSVNCDPVSAKVPAITFEAHESCGSSYVQGKILYLVPGNAFGNNERWTDAGAWFAAAFLKSVSGTTYSYWVTMLDEDGDGTFACEIPTGYNKVVICRMNPSNQAVMFQDVPNNGHANWNYKWNETGEINVPTASKKITITGWDKSYTNTDLESDKTFKTIVLNANGIWNADGAIFKAHPWVDGGADGGWPRMIKGINDGIYLIDVYTTYNRILFERCNPSDQSRWNVTSDLVLDIYGNEFKILEAGGHGEWHWRWFKSDYELGVQTDVVKQNGENLEIYCTGVVYKTDCAPGIKYGFEYATNQNMTGATYVEYAQGAIAPGASFEKYITVEPGEYYVRARAQYENGTIYYGWTKKVVVANQCDANYEFAVGSTSTTVQACGGNRVLPAVEIISDKNVGGGTIVWSYEWTNSDGSAATNLSAANVPSPTFNGTASQSYKVRVIKKVNGAIKCTQTADYSVVYDDNSPKGAIEAPTTVEINQEVKLQGSINNSEGFTWMVKEGSVDVTSLMLSDATILNPTFNTKEAGVYTITLTPDNNFTCVATPVQHTLTVTAPEEICGSNDIEVKLAGSHNCFNTNGGSNLYVSQNGSSWISVGKIENGKSYIFTADYFAEKGLTLPVKIFFGALNGNYCETNTERKGYTKVQSLSTDEQGYLITYTIGNPSGSTTDVNGYSREFTVTTNKVSNTTISAPTVTSPSSIVEGTATEATLMAYLSATGCSDIAAYGFQYIMQDDEPTSATGATTKELSLPVTIGKSFKTTLTDLAEGVYWFRGYATNKGDKTAYTAWSSFTIITDGPYPTLKCGLGALQLLANGKIQVIVTNQGNQPVLEGSYSLSIVNQGATMVYTPLPVPQIAANSGTATFITTNPVANKNNYSVTATLTYKGRKQQCSIKACTPQIGGKDTIFYTIDAAAVTDKCMLVFPTVDEAISHLKSSTADGGFVTKHQNKEGYMLNQPVVMKVVYAKDPYKGSVRVGTTGGMTDGRPEPYIIAVTNINNDGNDGTGTYHPLIIRAANPNAKPALQHIAIRKSRNITLANLNLVSSETDIDNAIDIDNNNNNWVDNEIGRFANANVTIKNCLIKSKGFTCMHVSAVTKVYFINNEILADLSNSDIKDGNTRKWGSSAKFIRCKDILFLRNNFTGTHATSMWLQGVEGALLMNNVFWNNNKIEDGKSAIVRIVQQSSPEKPKDIGIYYNTMYLADCDRSKNPNVDFLTLNSDEADAINHNGDFETSSIEFMYNNCYSYDDKTPGKSTSPFKGREPWAGLCHNNFWSVKDQNTTPAPSKSAFAFGDCDVNYVNVKGNVCTTTASDPNSLVISGTGLNTGIQPNTTLAKKLGADLVVSDRTREDIRPTTPTIIDPDDVPSGVVDAGGMAPSIALVVSEEEGTMTHTIDVVTYVGATRGVEYTAALQNAKDFAMNDNANGTVTVSFNKAGKTQNLTYSDNLIVSKNNVDDIIIPITGKYVASYTGGWTLGAYQQTESIATDSIIWQGGTSDEWDNRNNWIDAKTKNTLTCVNTLAKDLKVIIPAPHSENYPAPDEQGIVTYPKLPAFDNRDAAFGAEIVNAGQGLDGITPKQFANHIYMEYGAALQGVENLVDGEVSRYNEATTHLTVDREKWFLVGNMVKPFTNINKTETRLTISGDYYITRQEPRVYMHQITVEGDMPAWQQTFADLEVIIQPTEVFAISIPDLYGSMRFNAQRYYTYVSPNPSKLNDGTVPKSYTFNGRFINESQPLTFEGLSSSPVLVNNTYPCNLSASAIEKAGYTVYLYDHDKNSWLSPELDGSSKIKPQHGFAMVQKTGGSTLEVTTNMLANGNTYHYEKSANATMPYHVIELFNANSTDGYASQIQVVYDAEKGAAQLDARDAEKLWSNNTMVPDLYMMMYDVTLQRLYVEKPEMVIPLGVRLQQDMDVTFKMAKTNGIEKAILEDRLTGKEYDLTGNKEATITGLEVGKTGVIEGRFYLNLVAEDQFNFDTPTDITDAIVETNSINIYVSNGNNLSVLANNVDLQTVYVSDMSGRTQRYDVSGSYANITLPVSQGVYVVQVIGDNLTRTDKVIVK